jgi:hypothetical protein
MKTRHLVLALGLGLGLAGAAQAQVVGYNFRTGDVWVDSQLGYMNDYGRYERGYFVDDIVGSYGAPRYLVNDLLDNRRWDPGDVYYASALAYQLRRPLADVVRERDRNRGQGWGVIAQRMGIKPGSAEFHALKGHMGKSKSRYEAHGGRPGNSGKGRSDLRVDDGPGNSGGKGKPTDAGKGKPADAGPGNSGKGNSGKGNSGKGNGKGQGKP